MNLLLEITTPESVIYKDEATSITTTTTNGEITILPNHIGLFTQLQPGEMTIRKGTKSQSIAITGGFLEIADNKVSVLAEYAIRAQDIEVAKIQEAKKRAEKLMKEKSSEKDLKIAEAEMIKAILQLKVATKHKRRID